MGGGCTSVFLFLAFPDDYAEPSNAPKSREDWVSPQEKWDGAGGFSRVIFLCELREAHSVVKGSELALIPCSTVSSLVTWGSVTSLCLGFLLGKMQMMMASASEGLHSD